MSRHLGSIWGIIGLIIVGDRLRRIQEEDTNATSNVVSTLAPLEESRDPVPETANANARETTEEAPENVIEKDIDHLPGQEQKAGEITIDPEIDQGIEIDIDLAREIGAEIEGDPKRVSNCVFVWC